MENIINDLRMCIHNYIQRVVLYPCLTELLHVSFHKHSVWFWVSKLLLMVLDIFLRGNNLIIEQIQRLMVALSFILIYTFQLYHLYIGWHYSDLLFLNFEVPFRPSYPVQWLDRSPPPVYWGRSSLSPIHCPDQEPYILPASLESPGHSQNTCRFIFCALLKQIRQN